MSELFLKIEKAESIGEERDDIYEATCQISKHEIATRELLDAFIRVVLEEEKTWQEIEHRVDYQAQFRNRQEARTAFLREYFRREKEA